MYVKDKPLYLRSSVSALNNNLNCIYDNNEVHFVSVHKNVANVIYLSKNGEASSHQVCSKDSDKNLILEAKFCVVGNEIILVIASQEGVQMYDVDGSILLHWHAFSNREDTLYTDTFARGICVVKEYLCVGTHDGSILAFRAFSVNSLGKEQPYTLQFHNFPISHLSKSNDKLISADDNGILCLWKLESGAFKKIYTFSGFGFPCTSTALWRDLIIAGYTSGHLRLFSIKNRSLLAQVVAHARTVTALDLVPATGQLLSTSEDTFFRVWQLAEEPQDCIEHKFSHSVPESQLCGGCFINEKGTELCVVAYDSEEIICFKQPKEFGPPGRYRLPTSIP